MQGYMHIGILLTFQGILTTPPTTCPNTYGILSPTCDAITTAIAINILVHRFRDSSRIWPCWLGFAVPRDYRTTSTLRHQGRLVMERCLVIHRLPTDPSRSCHHHPIVRKARHHRTVEMTSGGHIVYLMSRRLGLGYTVLESLVYLW